MRWGEYVRVFHPENSSVRPTLIGVVNIPDMFMFVRAIPKTAFFTLRYFGLRRLASPPVLVSHLVKLKSMAGRIILPADSPTGLIRMGFGDIGIFDRNRRRTVWQNFGTVEFKGRAHIGHGAAISVGQRGVAQFGNGFILSAESTICCGHKISFGDSCLVSWDVLVMDQDFHVIANDEGERINPDAPILIGDYVWIGCRAVVLKGSRIPSNSMVAATALVSAEFNEERTILAGSPAKVVKRGITCYLDDAALFASRLTTSSGSEVSS